MAETTTTNVEAQDIELQAEAQPVSRSDEANNATQDDDVYQVEEKVRMICEGADEIKARDIVTLDVRGQTIITDFFVVCSGTSITHIQSIAEGVKDRLRERARLRARPEGDAHSYWVILDYSDVILHIFSEETREFYDLERLWSDARVTPWAGDAAMQSDDNS